MNDKNDNANENKLVSISKARENKQRSEIIERFVAEIGNLDRHYKINKEKLQKALQLLLKHARTDTGGGRRCAMLLLSLWNGDNFKADLQALLYTDPDIFEAMIYVFHTLYYSNTQLDSHLAEEEIKPIYELWGETLRT